MSISKIKKHIETLNNQKFEIFNSCKIFSKLIANSFSKNKKLLIAGNGGSASDAQHISAELQIRFANFILTSGAPTIASFGESPKIVSRIPARGFAPPKVLYTGYKFLTNTPNDEKFAFASSML